MSTGLQESLAAAAATAARAVLGDRQFRIAGGAPVEAVENAPRHASEYGEGAFVDSEALSLVCESRLFRTAYTADPETYIGALVSWPAGETDWRIAEIRPGAAFTILDLVSIEQAQF